MNTPDAVYWASAALMWIVTIFACLMYWRDRRKLRAAIPKPGELFTAALGVSRTDDAALADWTRRTMLTVTTLDGMIEALTLADLYTGSPAHRTDSTWADPICVSIWTGNPRTIEQFRADLPEHRRG